mmetsp:Transcript_30349/g.48327  ORF Transcript_30349/g.48327 Transcript_30349/m.48327 type:complete len:428 (-) Transcript_30349:5540-6823(-)
MLVNKLPTRALVRHVGTRSLSGPGALLADRAKGRAQGNIFADATAMANKHASVNLGQGFPSFPTPDFVKKCAQDAVAHNHNQYTRPGGNPYLVETLAEYYSSSFQRRVDPLTEIATCSGAQEGIFNVVATFCNQGDQVLCVEPYFDAYKRAADLVGAITKGVPLRMQGSDPTTSASLKLDVNELDNAITDKTKLLILNTPHNPTGKVFSKEELEDIAQVVRKHPQLIVLSDEVYEFMTFDGLKHERFANVQGMWDRTISLFSAGKTFSCTGWRIGYCIGPSKFCTPLQQTQGIVAFCAATPFEVAAADSFKLAQENGYFDQLPATLEKKRDALCAALEDAGMKPIIPEGGYFVMADTSDVPVSGSEGVSRDVAVNQWLTENTGVTGIPTSYFYSEENRHLSDNVLRYAFCKTDEEIAAASKNLHTAK